MRLDIIKTIFSRLNLFEKTSVPTTPASGIGSLWLRDDSTYGRKSIAYVGDDGIVKDLAEMDDVANLATKAGAPAYYLGGSTAYLNADLLAAHLVNTNNTKGMIALCGQIHNIASGNDYLWCFGDTNADELIAMYTNTTDGKLTVICKIAGTTQWQFTTTSAEIAVDTDYRIVVFQDATAPYLAINGRLIPITFDVSTDKTKWFAHTTGIDNGRIGCSNYNSGGNINNLNCTVRYFNAWNTVLSVSAIDKILQSGQVPYKYLGAIQTELISDATDRDFNPVSAHWTNISMTTFNATGDLTVTASSSGLYCSLPLANCPMVAGKAYRLKYDVSNLVGTMRIYEGNGSDIIVYTIANGLNQTVDFISHTSGGLRIYSGGVASVDMDNFSLSQIGCVADYSPEGIGHYSVMDNSGNGLHATNSGALPVGLPANARQRAWKASISNTPTALTNIVPIGYEIRSIRAKGSDALTGVKIGTSSGGEQVVASASVAATAGILTLASTANDGYSETAAQTLYAEHGTAGQTLELYFLLERMY